MSDEYKNKQVSILNELFYYPEEPISHFVKTIEKYLKDNINIEYKKFHDTLVKNFLEKNFAINDLNSKLIDKEKELKILNEELAKCKTSLLQTKKSLNYYESGKLYKLCKKIYKIKNKE